MRGAPLVLGLVLTMAGPLQARQVNPLTQEATVVDPAALQDALTSRYPASLERYGIGGTVVMRAFVRTDGKADSVHVASSSGIQPLDAAAGSVVRAATFHPALEEGLAVDSWVTLALTFGEDAPSSPEAHPRILDREELKSRLQAFAPNDLQRSRIFENVILILGVDREGQVAHVREPRPSCFPSASRAARDAAPTFSFDRVGAEGPEVRRSVATLLFQGDTVMVQLLGDSFPPPRPREPQSVTPPSDLPSQRPEIRNREEVAREISRRYPPRLRDQGVTGNVVVWVVLDESGRPTGRRIAASSGYCEFDLAALEVARIMRFSPATARGEPTPVVASIPITFRPPSTGRN